MWGILSKFEKAHRTLGRLSLGERLLLAVSYNPTKVGAIESYDRPTAQWTVDTALETLRWSFFNLDDLIVGKRVLDYGSGDGFQSVALAQAGADFVLGVEIDPKRLKHARRLATSTVEENLDFNTHIEGKFDVAISLNSMEHFVEPEKNLQEIRDALVEGGKLLLSFGPPWWAPYGSHMYFFCPIPWINLVFSERTVMRVRSLYRADGLSTYSPELNQMSIRKFECLIEQSGFQVDRRKYHCVKGLNVLSKVPVLREIFINQVDVTLSR